MNFKCPRCGKKKIERASGNSMAYGGGLVGAMLASAFGSYQCRACGPIARHEFPRKVQQKMMQNTIFLAVGAGVIFVAAIGIIIYPQIAFAPPRR